MTTRCMALAMLLLATCGRAPAQVNPVLRLAGSRHLTGTEDGRVEQAFISPDGKRIVYALTKGNTSEFRLADVVTRKSTKIVLPASTVCDYTTEEVEWSPNSKLFALCGGSAPVAERQTVMVFSSSGSQRTCYRLPSTSSAEGASSFSADSTRLALQVFDDRGRSILILNTLTGKARLLQATVPAEMDLEGFSNSGRCVECVDNTVDPPALRAIPIDGSPSHILVKNYKCGYMESPDGKFEIGDGSGAVMDGPGLSLINRRTRRATVISKDDGVEFETWSSDSRMLLYSEPRDIANRELWLSYATSGKHSIRVARDADVVSCSDDFRRMAYISQGQLYVAELAPQQSHISKTPRGSTRCH